MDPVTHEVCQVCATAGETDFCATPVSVSVQGDEVHEMAGSPRREDDQCPVRQQAPWSPTEASFGREGAIAPQPHSAPPVVEQNIPGAPLPEGFPPPQGAMSGGGTGQRFKCRWCNAEMYIDGKGG